jgi:hypothetical protein
MSTAMRRLILFFSFAISLAPTVRAAPPAPDNAPGLTVDAQGRLVRGGRPVRAVGVNYFDAFLRTLQKADDTSYDAGFATLAEYKIPFARFAACGYWPSEMGLYLTNKDEYFRRLDGVVRSAEKHGVGLIPSLFWNWSTLPDLAGEPCDQWGNPASKTHALMRAYVRDVVERYKDSPAVWGWEFGNEYNLPADLPDDPRHRPPAVPQLGTPERRGPRDRLTTQALHVALMEFAREVRRHDPSRFITSGNSLPRNESWHLWKEGKWAADDPAQSEEVIDAQHPAPMDVISVHYYVKDRGYLKAVAETAARLHKPLFIGEFGYAGAASPENDQGFAEVLRQVEAIGAPLSAVWVFDYPGQEQEGWNITATNAHAARLKLIAEANRRAEAAKAATGG